MALGILRGPAGAGKSQELRPGEIRADITAIWAALMGYERDADGRYPVRADDDPALGMAHYLKATAIAYAAREGIAGWTTTSDSSPEALERLREQGATGEIRTIDPGEPEVRRRLAGPGGIVSGDCEQAIQRWFGRLEPGAAERLRRNR